MWLFLPLLLACAGAPRVEVVEPVTLLAGEPVEVRGEGFAEDAGVALISAEGQAMALEQVSLEGATILRGITPATLAPGHYTVEVTTRGREASLPLALEVVLPRHEVACSDDYTTNTQLSLARALVVIDRFHRSGERETLQIPIGEVERVEYEESVTAAGEPCYAIYLRHHDGRRLVFDDDRQVRLEPRARKIARDMQIPVEIPDDATAEAAAEGSEDGQRGL